MSSAGTGLNWREARGVPKGTTCTQRVTLEALFGEPGLRYLSSVEAKEVLGKAWPGKEAPLTGPLMPFSTWIFAGVYGY